MTTALDIIQGTLRKIGVYQVGETLASEDANIAFDQLNALLDVLSNEHLAVYNNAESVLSLQAGKGVYTVGAGGDFDIARPLRISTAYTRLTPTGSSVDYPCTEVDFDRYSRIGLKNQPGPWPKVMYYDTSYPLANLYVWPVPSQNAEFHLWADMVFASFVNLTDKLQMPQGYRLLLETNLACLLAPEYGIVPEAHLVGMARALKKSIKSTNSTPQGTASYDGAIVASGASDAGWILTGGF